MKTALFFGIVGIMFSATVAGASGPGGVAGKRQLDPLDPLSAGGSSGGPASSSDTGVGGGGADDVGTTINLAGEGDLDPVNQSAGPGGVNQSAGLGGGEPIMAPSKVPCAIFFNPDRESKFCNDGIPPTIDFPGPTPRPSPTPNRRGSSLDPVDDSQGGGAADSPRGGGTSPEPTEHPTPDPDDAYWRRLLLESLPQSSDPLGNPFVRPAPQVGSPWGAGIQQLNEGARRLNNQSHVFLSIQGAGSVGRSLAPIPPRVPTVNLGSISGPPKRSGGCGRGPSAAC
jgi:hypothetical protein